MSSLREATRLYDICGKLELREHAVDDELTRKLFDLVRALHAQLGDIREEESERLTRLFRFMRWATRTPMPYSECGVSPAELGDALSSSRARLLLINPPAARVLEEIAKVVNELVASESCPLREKVLELARADESVPIFVSKQHLTIDVERSVRSAAILNRVLCPREPSKLPEANAAILVGPLDEYPGHLFLAPRIAVLHSVVHSWKHAPPEIPRLPEATGAAVALSDRAAAYVRPAQSTVDIDALLRHMGREDVGVQETASAREKVEARLVRLAGDHFMFIEIGGAVRVFHLEESATGPERRLGLGSITTSSCEVEALEPDMYILERTRGGTPMLEAVAEKLVGAEQEMKNLQDSQRMWKATLASVIDDIGVRELARILLEAGCSSARPDLIRSWVYDETILPGEENCLRKILALAGKSDEEIDTVVENGKKHRSRRVAAGMQISRLLTDELRRTVDPAELLATGTAEVSFGTGASAPRMKMLRVEGVEGSFQVPQGQLRLVYDRLSDVESA